MTGSGEGGPAALWTNWTSHSGGTMMGNYATKHTAHPKHSETWPGQEWGDRIGWWNVEMVSNHFLWRSNCTWDFILFFCPTCMFHQGHGIKQDVGRSMTPVHKRIFQKALVVRVGGGPHQAHFSSLWFCSSASHYAHFDQTVRMEASYFSVINSCKSPFKGTHTDIARIDFPWWLDNHNQTIYYVTLKQSVHRKQIPITSPFSGLKIESYRRQPSWTNPLQEDEDELGVPDGDISPLQISLSHSQACLPVSKWRELFWGKILKNHNETKREVTT
jgi:hypothetical protein